MDSGKGERTWPPAADHPTVSVAARRGVPGSGTGCRSLRHHQNLGAGAGCASRLIREIDQRFTKTAFLDVQRVARLQCSTQVRMPQRQRCLYNAAIIALFPAWSERMGIDAGASSKGATASAARQCSDKRRQGRGSRARRTCGRFEQEARVRERRLLLERTNERHPSLGFAPIDDEIDVPAAAAAGEAAGPIGPRRADPHRSARPAQRGRA
jgi:hypothetical protein